MARPMDLLAGESAISRGWSQVPCTLAGPAPTRDEGSEPRVDGHAVASDLGGVDLPGAKVGRVSRLTADEVLQLRAVPGLDKDALNGSRH